MLMKAKLVFCFIFFFLSACAVVKPSSQTATPTTLTRTSSPVLIPTIKTIVPTKSAEANITPTPSFSPSLTPTKIPTARESYKTRRCVDAINSEQENILNSGSILFYWPKTDSIMSFSANALDPKTVLPGLPYFSVSPYSSTYLWVTTSGIYNVKTSDGKYYQTKYNPDWGFDRQWLLGDKLIIGHNPSEFYPDRKAKDDIYVLTLNTGEYVHYKFDLPEYFANGPGNGEVQSPVYDPTGSLVAYGWDNPNTSESGMLIWDVINEKEIWKRSGWGWLTLANPISWQYDGSHVFIVAPPLGKESPPEIFSIDKAGKETQLSNLGEVFTSTYLIHDIVISPDGNKIALSIDTKVPSPYNLYSLYVFDIQTGEVLDYCTSVFQTLVWSPLSDQLAFITEPVWGESQLMVLDIESGKKMAIDDRTRGLYGWVNWSPP